MTFDLEMLKGLPEPVQRYFAFALSAGQKMIQRAKFVQEGQMALSPGKWIPFTATEEFTASPPSFIWLAKVKMMPLVSFKVRDSYADGVGSMQAKLWGSFAIVNQWGTPEMAAASLLRYLAEAAWLPTALLPQCGVEWAPIDDKSAVARLQDHGVGVSATVKFGQNNEILEVAGDRHREVKGRQVLTPWRGRFSKYKAVDGMMVPGWGEVEWILPEGPQMYWRGSNLECRYEFA